MSENICEIWINLKKLQGVGSWVTLFFIPEKLRLFFLLAKKRKKNIRFLGKNNCQNLWANSDIIQKIRYLGKKCGIIQEIPRSWQDNKFSIHWLRINYTLHLKKSWKIMAKCVQNKCFSLTSNTNCTIVSWSLQSEKVTLVEGVCRRDCSILQVTHKIIKQLARLLALFLLQQSWIG